MKQRWAPGFTIVELLIVVVVIAILAAIATVAYNGIISRAANTTVQAQLRTVSTYMNRELIEKGSFPSILPANLSTNSNTTTQIKSSGVSPRYSSLTTVQNGTLLQAICQNLIDANVGKGQDQGGTTRDYITGCGQWNNNSMQVTGWNTRTWNTPVTVQQLRDYGNSFTTSDTFNKAGHELVVKNFYNGMADAFLRQGGSSPITTFWDYWATSGNGGVMPQPLPTNPSTYHYFCIEAQSTRQATILWHVTETNELLTQGC